MINKKEQKELKEKFEKITKDAEVVLVVTDIGVIVEGTQGKVAAALATLINTIINDPRASKEIIKKSIEVEMMSREELIDKTIGKMSKEDLKEMLDELKSMLGVNNE